MRVCFAGGREQGTHAEVRPHRYTKGSISLQLTEFMLANVFCRFLKWIVSCSSAIQKERCDESAALCARTHAR